MIIKGKSIGKLFLFCANMFFIAESGISQVKNKSNINSCTLAKNVFLHQETILNVKIKSILKTSGDNCNLALVDSLSAYFIRSPKLDGYRMLRSLSNFSDGALSEYFVETISDIYNKSFPSFFEYLYTDHKKNESNKLENMLIECWSNIVASTSDKNSEIKKIEDYTRNIINKTKKETGAKTMYLNSLLKKINPAYLD